MRVSIAAKIMALVIVSVVATVAIVEAVANFYIRDGYEKITSRTVRS